VERPLRAPGPPGCVVLKEVATTWRVECRTGDADSGKTKTWNLADEDDAHASVQRLLETAGDGWIDLSGRTGNRRDQS
jgi:hypothetical protein